MVAPSLCMAFKGTLPSDLWLKYSVEGGRHLMELDLIIAANINDKISEATDKAKTDGKSMVARRNQRRKQRKLLSNNSDLFEALRESGVEIVNDPKSSGEGK